MADAGRKDFSTKAQETLTPDSQKSTLDKAKESVTDAGDTVASSLQPGDSKSTTQKLGDTASSGAKDAENSGQTYLEQAQEVGSNLFKSASDAATNLANSISGNK